jgi:hypothetical protein
MAEVIRYYQPRIDWDVLFAKAQQFDLVAPVQQILSRLDQDWQLEIPRPVQEHFAVARSSPQEARFFTELVYRQESPKLFLPRSVGLRNWLERLGYLIDNCFPAPAFLKRRYRILHPFLIPLAYPFRWMRGLRIWMRALRSNLIDVVRGE